MNQADLEKYTFLYFCGKKDRDILLGKRKMTLEDLERFSYLTDLFGFRKYHAQIWNSFSGEFEEKFEALEELYKEDADAALYDSANSDPDDSLMVENINDTGRQELWKKDFLKNVPDRQARGQLAEMLKNSSNKD